MIAERPLPVTPVHLFKPGDWVWLKDWKLDTLQPSWRGTHAVILTTPTALKLEGIKPWIHHSRVKQVHEQWAAIPNPDNPLLPIVDGGGRVH